MKLRDIFFVVRKLIFSKRNKGIVHIISLISLIGIAVVSFALVVVLSVFNGFTSVAEQMLAKENPPILISAQKGKKFSVSQVEQIKNIEGIQTVIPIVNQTILLTIGDERQVVQMIGTDESYFHYNPLDTSIVNGIETFDGLKYGECIMGINLALKMGLNKGAEKMNIPIKVSIPQKQDDAIVVEDMLKTTVFRYTASYITRSDLDDNYIFVSIDNARELLSYKKDEVNYLYVLPSAKYDTEKIIKEIRKNENFKENLSVKNIFEQQPLYFRIAKSEKMAVYIILSLIIFIATINIISTLIILNIQKENMNFLFRAIGTTKKDLRNIYFLYGQVINVLGCFIGVIIGVVFCYLQQQFGFIKLTQDSFVIDSFPIKILFWDIIRVIVIVLIIGTISIRMVSKRIKIN